MNDRLYFKERQHFKTVFDSDYIDYDLPLYSNDKQSGTVHIYDPTGKILDTSLDLYWLCFKGHIFYIDGVDPQENDTFEIKVLPPIEAFYRTHTDVSYKFSNEGLLLDALFEANYRDQGDALYAMPYLISLANDTSEIIRPDLIQEFMTNDSGLKSSGFFVMSEYAKKVVKHNTMLQFSYTNTNLIVRNLTKPSRPTTLYNGDGHTYKTSYSYDKNVVEKVDVSIMTKNEQGSSIVKPTRYTYYLTDGVDFSSIQPANRKLGVWERSTISEANQQQIDAGITDETLAHDAAQKIFEKNTEEIKIEFYHDKHLEWGLPVRIKINNTIWTGCLSSCRITNEDERYFYTIGDLKTTISEKLRGLL